MLVPEVNGCVAGAIVVSSFESSDRKEHEPVQTWPAHLVGEARHTKVDLDGASRGSFVEEANRLDPPVDEVVAVRRTTKIDNVAAGTHLNESVTGFRLFRHSAITP